MSTLSKYRLITKDREKTEANEIRITANGYTSSYISYAMKVFEEKKFNNVVLKGSGTAISKCCIIAEVLRHRIQGLALVSKIKNTQIHDEYEPREEGLDVVTVSRSIAVLEIVLTLDPTNDDKAQVGFQAALSEEEVKKSIKEHEDRRGEREDDRERGGRGGRRGGGRGFRRGGGRGRGRGGPPGEREYREERGDREERGGERRYRDREDDREGGYEHREGGYEHREGGYEHRERRSRGRGRGGRGGRGGGGGYGGPRAYSHSQENEHREERSPGYRGSGRGYRRGGGRAPRTRGGDRNKE